MHTKTTEWAQVTAQLATAKGLQCCKCLHPILKHQWYRRVSPTRTAHEACVTKSEEQ